MNCRETREKLSALADNELGSEELQRMRGHLAECPTCRQEQREQGALDMLLKSCFVKEPPETTLDGIWPAVSDQIQSGSSTPPSNGGGAVREGEIVFKSSSAMQMLRIPEAPAPVAAKEPVAPPPQKSSLAWPIAMIISAAILAGGFLLYKRMTPATPLASEEQLARSEPAPTEPTPQPGMAPASQEGASPASEPGEGTTDPGEELATTVSLERKGAARHKRAAKGVRVAAAKPAAGQKGEPPRPEAKTEAPAAPAKAGKKGDDLDNLIDDAIGSTGQPIVKKKKEEAASPKPASDEPDQLNMNQIRTAMNKVKGLVQACYDKYQIEGEARVTFTISNDGSIGDCGIKGKFFGTDTGACVVSAVKKARFPKFSGKAMTIANYPFLLQ